MRRAALVTGASGAIGRAIAAVLAADGFALTLAGRDSDRLAATATALHGSDTVTAIGDIGDLVVGQRLVDDHLAAHQRLDMLVLNAGAGRASSVAETRPGDLERMLAVHVIGPFTMIQRALPALRGAGAEHGGALILINASITGIWPARGAAAYSASKAAVVSLARSINLEEIEHGVRACALCPAYVDTPMSAWAGNPVDPSSMLRVDDVAAAVRFLLQLSPRVVVNELVLSRAGAPILSP
jgi:3-oxoacyl-[acyl-carrier protein] reductase